VLKSLHGTRTATAWPSDAARLVTSLPRVSTWRQLAPPSCVAHRPGSNAQPSLAFAKTTWLTESGRARALRADVGGGFTGNQARPPSVVLSSSSGQAGPLQRATPSSQPVDADTNVAEVGPTFPTGFRATGKVTGGVE